MAASFLAEFTGNTTLTTAVQQFSQTSSYDDYVVLALLALGGAGYLTRGTLWQKPDPYHYKWFERPQESSLNGASAQKETRNIAQKLEETKRDVVIFWGSQSGTAEGFANRLARDFRRRLKVDALVADLSDYDHDTIAQLPETKIAVFLVSTFGEGDPSDNSADFLSWLKTSTVSLKNVRYAAFGLGNSNYKYYNKVVDVVVEALDGFGASSLLPVGKADDASGMTEEDFLSWKDLLFHMFTKTLGFEEHEPEYEPALQVVEDISMDTIDLYHGEPVPQRMVKKTAAATSPLGALPIKEARELFTGADPNRSCIHMELDLSQTPEIKYKSGDHLAVWPINPTEEVNRLLRVLGLEGKQSIPLTILSLDPANTKVRVPTPTTALALFQHYLEICAPVSREMVLALAQFAPTASTKSLLLALGATKESYTAHLASHHVTLGRLLEHACNSTTWTSLPLSFIIESLSPLSPRYYSISSSSIVQPRTAALTAIVSHTPLATDPLTTIPGLTTSYLSTLLPTNPSSSSSPSSPSYPTNTVGNLHAQIRRSLFKLPTNPSHPIILIAAGTGIAPFRAFLHERARLRAMGKPVGPTLLFFGCRNDAEYLYRAEIEALAAGALAGVLEVRVAYSRKADVKKMYVQDCVEGEMERVAGLVVEADAVVFLCGSSAMAREVGGRVGEGVKRRMGWGETELRAWSERQKKIRRWQEDVWG